MNRAARALGRAAGDLADELRRYVRDDFDPDSDEVQELERAIIEEIQRAEFQLLVAVGQLEQGPFARVEDSITIDMDAVAALANVAFQFQSMVEAVRLLRSGVVVAQRLVSRQLLR